MLISGASIETLRFRLQQRLSDCFISLSSAQADALPVRVDAKDFDSNAVAAGDHLERFGNRDVGQFADVNKPFDARLKLGERAKIDHARDGDQNRVVQPVALFNALPGIRKEPLAAECNAAALRVQPQNLDLNALAHPQYVARVTDRCPADLADVKQPVRAADIDESAKRTQAAHLALNNRADRKFLEQLRFAACAVFALGQAVGENKPPPLPLHFDDLDRQFLADDLLQPFIALLFVHVSRQPDDMGSGDEAAQVVKVGQ